MKNREWAIQTLLYNGYQVDRGEKVIFLGTVGPGLKMWSAIDCLCNFYKFRWVRY